MDIQWFPGHMTKAIRQMQEDLKLIDLVIELADARIPVSSRNPEIDRLAANKARVLILNKADLADPAETKKWIEAYSGAVNAGTMNAGKDESDKAVAIDSRNKKDLESLMATIDQAVAAKRERDRKRGIINRSTKAMIVGIPNIGKSTLINSLSGKKSAKTGNKPGVTKGKQWIHVNKQLDLLDTPGILWPKFDDKNVGVNLACCGAVSDDVVQIEELAILLYKKISAGYPGIIEKKYGTIFTDDLSEDSFETSDLAGTSNSDHFSDFTKTLDSEKLSSFTEISDSEILPALAENLHLLKAGAEPDTGRAARQFIDDFRGGRLGRITLEPLEG